MGRKGSHPLKIYWRTPSGGVILLPVQNHGYKTAFNVQDK